MTEYDAIPDELQETDRWVCWNDEKRKSGLTKIPKVPDGSGRNASSTDPETWGTFEQAVATAEERGWGIGFVFTEDGEYVGIDLDDCLNERGGPADWLPSLEIFNRETYIERSPSGNSLHIIAKNTEIPEWWTNQHGKDDGREVAVFEESRFFTFTGDTIETSAEEVGTIDGFDEWLLEAWDEFNDAPPETSDRKAGTHTSSRSLSRRSRESIDVRVTDVVHAGYTCGERHEHPVHGSSTGANFLVDEDDETFRCWRHDVTGNALHIVGMKEAIIDCGEWKHGGLDTETWSEIFEAARDRGLEVPDRPEPPSVEEAKDEGWLDWGTVRDFYADPDFKTQQARQSAVYQLRAKCTFITPRDTGAIWVYDEDRGVFEKNGDTLIETKLETHLGSHYNQHEKREILGKIRAATYCDRETFDAEAEDRELLCVANGVLDLEERELLDHSPAYRFTRGLPVEYDPDADPEKIDAFMDEITSRAEDKETMYEMLGNSLAPHYDHSAFLILFGEGANGKSTFFDVAEALLGSENVSGWGLQDLEDNRFATSSLPGKFANIAPDLPGRSVTQTGTIKALTGGDTMMAEEKGEPAFEFVNNAKLMFGANRPPVIQEASMAIKRRILPIRLPKQFTTAEGDGNPDARPKHKLLAELTAEEELAGLLNRALDGLDTLRETGRFSLPETPEERLEYYEQFSDPIKEFAINCLENEQGETVPKSAIYEAYKQFSAAEDYQIRSRSVFYRQLRQVSTFTFNEFQPRNGDGTRTRHLKAATLTAEGIEYCDDLLLEELGLAADDDDDDKDAPTMTTDLGDVVPEGNPFYDVEVTVNKMREKSKGPAYEGTVRDETATLEFVDWFGLPGLGDLEEGATYLFTDVKAAYDSNGSLHLQPVENTTEWMLRAKERSEGQTPIVEHGDSGGNPEGSDTEEPVADTPESEKPGDPRELVVQLTTAKARAGDESSVAREELLEALIERGVSRSEAEHEVDKALRQGRIHEPTSGRYRPV